jgi:uncharacterized membrane protein
MLLPIVIGAAALGLIAMKRRRHGRCHAYSTDCGGHGCHGGRSRHGGRRHGWRGGLYSAMVRLGTTPGQEKVLREELNRLRELGRAARGEAFDARGDLADALRGEALDRTRLDAAVGRLDGAYASLKAAFVDSLGRLHETLDARQREKLAEFLGDRRGPASGPFRT